MTAEWAANYGQGDLTFNYDRLGGKLVRVWTARGCPLAAHPRVRPSSSRATTSRRTSTTRSRSSAPSPPSLRCAIPTSSSARLQDGALTMDRDTAENLVMGCVGTMLLFPAVEHSSLPDIVRAAQMIEASHPRPGNGRIEGTAVWLTALCIRFATRRCEAPTAIVVSDIRVASRRMPAARELLTGAAYAMLASTTYKRIHSTRRGQPRARGRGLARAAHRVQRGGPTRVRGAPRRGYGQLMTFTFRNAGPSGRGTGRIRYYVDIDGGDCIGSVEGKTGDYRLDFDYATDGVHNGAQSFHTRMDAARALADGAAKAAKPPVSAEEYRLLQRARRGEVFAMPALGFARILSAPEASSHRSAGPSSSARPPRGSPYSRATSSGSQQETLRKGTADRNERLDIHERHPLEGIASPSPRAHARGCAALRGRRSGR